MNFLLERVTPPDSEPVTLTEAKEQIRGFAGTADDALLTRLIQSAREWVEEYSGRSLIEQQWKLTFESQPAVSGDIVAGFMVTPFRKYWPWQWNATGEILLRRSPIISIDSFKSVDSLGVETNVPTNNYELREPNSKWPRLFPINGAYWFLGSYRITFKSGYSDEELIPACFKSAILLHVEAHYDRDPVMMGKLLEAAEKQLEQERSNLGIA